ncbi:serine/threonine-protein kinase [Streptomyces sp. NPDC048603]|uniref:serine/threonine-protein kinase n=1 Tax=Streptomyces sp. NPDC048603 TaxID=3365577 RepID=UPI003719ACE1
MSGQPGDRSGSVQVFHPLGAEDPATIAGYRLAARLGAGGMGKVYLSYTPGGRPVAIKVIRPEFAEDAEFRRRFAQEVQSAQRVQGLFTAPVIDADTDGARPWLATAYVPGPSLADAVVAHGPLPVGAVLLLVAGMAEALQVIHGAGIVHRDLKPSNVLLAADGPRVIDFGIAYAADATSLTSSGVTIGTPSFMAPEQAAARRVTPATDVFALGQVAAYAAAGTPAFGEGTSHGVLYRIVHEEPDLGGVPERLRELVGRCLAKEPAARPSIAEIIGLCQSANEGTVLRRPEDWLPAAVAADITGRAAAPAPAQAPPPPTVAPTAPATGAAPGVPAAPAAPPATYAPTAAATPPPAYSPTAVNPSAVNQSAPQPPQYGPGAGAPTQVPAHGHTGPHAPTQFAAPAPTPAPAPGPAPVAAQVPFPAPGQTYPGHPGHPGHPGYPAAPVQLPPRRSGRRGLVIALAAALVFGVVGGATVYSLLKNKDEDRQSQGGGSARNGSSSQGGQQGGGGTPTGSGAKAGPEPAEFKGVNLTAGYHLTLGDDQVRPQQGEDGGYELSYDTGGYLDAETQGGNLVLLDPGQQGSLAACRADTRFTQNVYVDKLAKGRQLCVTTGSGHLALVTVRGFSPEGSPSTYMTLDVTVWRNAAGSGSGS